MLKYRLISFPLLLALLGAIFFWQAVGPWLFAAAAVVLIPTALFESGRIAEKIGVANSPRFLALCGAIGTAVLLAPIPSKERIFAVALTLALPLSCFCFWIAVLRRRIDAVGKIAAGSGLFIFVWAPLVLLALIYLRDPFAFAFVVCTTKSMDTGGYIFGMLSSKLPGGNHKIAPAISPKKSWEGFFGGLLLSLVTGWLFYRFGSAEKPLSVMLSAAAIFSLGSFFGDLTESSFKRAAGVKDSGGWLPGMGGALDLVDSFIYNGMIFWVLQSLFRG